MDAILLAIANLTNRSWIRLAGDAYGQYWGGSKPNVLESLNKQLNDIAVATYISGHMPYGLHEKIKSDHLYATVLRNPVDRSWSQVRRIARDDPSVASVEIADLFASRRLIDNQQVRMIAGCTDVEQVCDEVMLDDAKRNLRDSYALIGFTESFDRFLKVLAQGLGWPSLLFRSRNASAAMKEQPDDDQRAILATHSRFDEDLVEYARSIASVKEQNFGNLLKKSRALESFERYHTLYSIDPFSIGNKPIGLIADADYKSLAMDLLNQGVSIKEVRA